MNRLFFLFLCTLSLPAGAWDKAVFLESLPYGASVRIGDEILPGQTPQIWQAPGPGTYTAEFYRPGYGTVRRTFTVASTGATQVRVYLDALSVTSQVWRGSRGPRPLRIPLVTGTWRQEFEGFTWSPQFPQQGLVEISAWTLPVAFTWALVSGLQDLQNPATPEMPLSTGTFSAAAALAVDLGWFFGLAAQKDRYERIHRALWDETAPSSLRGPEEANRLAEEALSGGRFAAAQEEWIELAAAYPDSDWAPRALMQAARLSAVLGQREDAWALWTLIEAQYPTWDTWDLTQKALGDRDFQSGFIGDTARRLGQLLFVNPQLTREEAAGWWRPGEAPPAQARPADPNQTQRLDLAFRAFRGRPGLSPEERQTWAEAGAAWEREGQSLLAARTRLLLLLDGWSTLRAQPEPAWWDQEALESRFRSDEAGRQATLTGLGLTSALLYGGALLAFHMADRNYEAWTLAATGSAQSRSAWDQRSYWTIGGYGALGLAVSSALGYWITSLQGE